MKWNFRCTRKRLLVALVIAAVGSTAVIVSWAGGTVWAARAPRALGGEPADAARAMAHVEHMATVIGPRPAGTASEAAAADYVAACLWSYGYRVRKTPFTRTVADGVCISENVVAVAPFPKPGAQTILIAASLDSPVPDSPGADDNATGIAAMLECARILAGVEARHNLAFAAFGASCMGRAGSKAFAEGAGGMADGSPIAPQDVMMAIVLDSVGRPGPVRFIPWGGPRALPPSVLAGLVDAVGGGRPFDTAIALLPEVPVDHSPFLFAGIPAVTITTAQSLPYPARGSLSPFWDTADAVDAAHVARAADAAMAAARWVSSQSRIPRPGRPYLAFNVFGQVLAVPYLVAAAVAAAAAILGLLSLGPAERALYSQFTRVRPGNVLRALAATLAVCAVLAAVLWTSFVPSLILGAVRGLERPWNAYPIPFAAAGATCALFFAVVAMSLAGTGARDELRLPLLRVSILLQIALVCLAFGAVRTGAFFPALGLLLTVGALAAPDGPLRRLLAWLAPLPAGWLAIRAAGGVARSALIDALEVPIVLCLLVAAAVLPYVLALVALTPGSGQEQSIAAGDSMPGVTLRQYDRHGARGMPAHRRRESPGIALMWALGLLTVILTAGLFTKPSYDGEAPQRIRAVQTGNAIVFQSEDNIRGVSVTGGPLAEVQTVDVRRSHFELARRLSAPPLKLTAQAAGSRISMSLSSGEPIAWIAFELEGPVGMEVASSDRGYVVERTGESVRISTMLTGASEPYESAVELSVPSGAQVSVRAVGGFRLNPSEIVLAGEGKRFYQDNQFIVSAEPIGM